MLFPKLQNTGVSQMNRANYTNKHSETYTAAVVATIIVLVKSEIQYNVILLTIYVFFEYDQTMYIMYILSLLFSWYSPFFAIPFNWQSSISRKSVNLAFYETKIIFFHSYIIGKICNVLDPHVNTWYDCHGTSFLSFSIPTKHTFLLVVFNYLLYISINK